MTTHPKSECADYFNISPKRAVLKNSSLTILCLLLSSPSLPPGEKKSLKFHPNNNISLPCARAPLSYHSTSFAPPTAKKPTAPCQWIMEASKHVFRGGPLTHWSQLTFASSCKPKWSQDEFNNQSHILQSLGTTSWVHGLDSSVMSQPGLVYVHYRQWVRPLKVKPTTRGVLSKNAAQSPIRTKALDRVLRDHIPWGRLARPMYNKKIKINNNNNNVGNPTPKTLCIQTDE